MTGNKIFDWYKFKIPSVPVFIGTRASKRCFKRSESQNESSEENEEEEINIDKVVREYENFEIVQNLLKVSCGLKEYIAYEVGKLRHRESDLLSQIREENKCLKS